MGLYKSFVENKGEEEIFSKKSLIGKVKFFLETQKERIEYNSEFRKSLKEARKAKRNFYYGPSLESSPIKESKNPLVKRIALGLALGGVLAFGGLKLSENYFPSESSQRLHLENVEKSVKSIPQDSENQSFSFDKDSIQNEGLGVKIKDYSFDNLSILTLDEMKEIGRSEGVVGLHKKITNDSSRVYYKDLKKGGKFYELALASGGVDLEKEDVSLEERAGLEINGINDYLSEKDIRKIYGFFYGNDSLDLDEKKSSFNFETKFNSTVYGLSNSEYKAGQDEFLGEANLSGNGIQELYDSYSMKIKNIQKRNNGLIPKKNSLDGKLRKDYLEKMKNLELISKNKGYSLS